MIIVPISKWREQFRRRNRNPLRISIYEAVGYTSALLFAGAIAYGLFDLMIPWGS
jgi:hypothetical protein